VAAQFGGLMMVMILSPFGTMAAAVLGSWGALAIVNRWR
jgi:hypothetical protein